MDGQEGGEPLEAVATLSSIESDTSVLVKSLAAAAAASKAFITVRETFDGRDDKPAARLTTPGRRCDRRPPLESIR